MGRRGQDLGGVSVYGHAPGSTSFRSFTVKQWPVLRFWNELSFEILFLCVPQFTEIQRYRTHKPQT